MSKKLTYEFVKESFDKEGYSLLSNEYKNAHIKLYYSCPNGHEHYTVWAHWQQGHRCPTCAGVFRLNLEYVQKSFKDEGYNLLSKKYVNASIKLNYICPDGHKHGITWGHWQQGKRCPYCSKNSKKTIGFVKDQFKREGYKLISKEYTDANTKLDCICPNGHEYSTTWSNWNKGSRCPSCVRSGKGNNFWKGGVSKENLLLFDTYSPQLNFVEELGFYIDSENRKLLKVKCSKCGKYYKPSYISVYNRIRALNGKLSGEHRLYCSQECKDNCEVYKRNPNSYLIMDKVEDINNVYNTQELSVWSKEVLKRSNYKCEICGNKAEHAHHIQPKKLEPGLALDPDNGLAVCKECHYKYGHKDRCSTGSLANIKCKGED